MYTLYMHANSSQIHSYIIMYRFMHACFCFFFNDQVAITSMDTAIIVVMHAHVHAATLVYD